MTSFSALTLVSEYVEIGFSGAVSVTGVSPSEMP
jgi:hypothetical protein